jgi:hypothetical protein
MASDEAAAAAKKDLDKEAYAVWKAAHDAEAACYATLDDAINLATKDVLAARPKKPTDPKAIEKAQWAMDGQPEIPKDSRFIGEPACFAIYSPALEKGSFSFTSEEKNAIERAKKALDAFKPPDVFVFIKLACFSGGKCDQADVWVDVKAKKVLAVAHASAPYKADDWAANKAAMTKGIAAQTAAW